MNRAAVLGLLALSGCDELNEAADRRERLERQAVIAIDVGWRHPSALTDALQECIDEEPSSARQWRPRLRAIRARGAA
jgi:hypothetical protein